MFEHSFHAKGVIFDLDGTLADTIADLGAAVDSVLIAHGLPGHALSSYKRMVGEGFAVLIRKALPPDVATNENLFKTIISEAADAYSARATHTTLPFPGVTDMLRSLSEAGIQCAVLSNKPDHMTKSMVEVLFPQFPFTHVIGDAPGRPRKPDPYSALAIASSSGIRPGKWAFVGDSGVDMRTAIASGMLPLGALWGYRDAAELRENGAEFLLASPNELLRYI